MNPDHRVGELVLRLVGPDGAPLADREVRIEQTRHAFRFGSTGFELIAHANGETDAGSPHAEQLAADWLGVFDTATLPFYLGDFEPHPGRTRTERIRTAARWFADRGVRLKGHPLVWHTVKAPWMDALGLDEAWEATLGRIRREVGDFRGLIEAWDVVNEAVIMPVFTNEPDGVPNVVSRIAREKGRIRRSPRSPTGASRMPEPGSVHRRGCCAPTDPASPPTRRCARSCAASGGSRRGVCTRMPGPTSRSPRSRCAEPAAQAACGAVLSRTTRFVARSMRGTDSSGAAPIRITSRVASSAIRRSGWRTVVRRGLTHWASGMSS